MRGACRRGNRATLGMQGPARRFVGLTLLFWIVPFCSCVKLRVTNKPTVQCASFKTCSTCGEIAECGWCTDGLAGGISGGGEKGCVSPDADCRLFDSRECLCEKAYTAMFPGTDMADKGPCQGVLKAKFKPSSCDPKESYKGLTCPNAAAQMIAACKNHIIPDVPAHNPTAGSLFNDNRADLIQAAYSKAGCPVEETLAKLLGEPEPEPVSKRLPYMVKHNYRGDCPESDYAGSMCGIETSQQAQDECTRDVHCKSYVWAGKQGNQKAKDAESFPNCLWMCESVPVMFASWKQGEAISLMGWEAGYVSSMSTPAPTAQQLQKMTATIDISGKGKVYTPPGFKVLGQLKFTQSVAEALHVMASELTIDKTEAVAPGTLRITFTLATYDTSLEKKAKKAIQSSVFANMLSKNLMLHKMKSHVSVNNKVSAATEKAGSSSSTSNIGVICGLLLGIAAGVAAIYMKGGDLTLAMGEKSGGDEESSTAGEKQGLTSED